PHTPLYEDPHIHERRWMILGVMAASLTLVVMSVSGLNVALPTIQESLEASNSALQWIIDSYALVFAGLLLMAGALGDRFGRRNALLVGLSIFATGAAVGGLAASAVQVIAGRVVMGAGAAFVMPATLSLVTTVFPPDERRRAIAVWAGFAGAGAAIGPIVSGTLLEAFWWGSALLVNIPIVILLMIAIAMLAPHSRDPHNTPLDPAGTVLSLIGITALVFAIIEGPNLGWTNPGVLIGFGTAALTLFGFVARQRSAAHPMLPLELFGDLRFAVGSAVITVTFFAMIGFFFLNTLYLQFVRGYSALYAGLAAVPVAVMQVWVAPRSSSLSDRFGSGRVIATGFGFIAAGFAVLAMATPQWPYLPLGFAYALLGTGMGITAAPATGNIMSAVPDAKAGVGSAVNDTTREFGGALGIAVLGSIITSAYQAGLRLDGLGLSPAQAAEARDSVGGAGQVAKASGSGAELIERAGVAFTSAFNIANGVSALLAFTAAVAVAVVFSPSREEAAARAAAGRSAPL
ncbi:MAG: MFS transporter, partial [Candidatus Microthrix parvicella]